MGGGRFGLGMEWVVGDDQGPEADSLPTPSILLALIEQRTTSTSTSTYHINTIHHQVGRLRCLEALGDYPSLLQGATELRTHLLSLLSLPAQQPQSQPPPQWREWMAQTLLLGSKAALSLGSWGEMDAFLSTRRSLSSSSSSSTWAGISATGGGGVSEGRGPSASSSSSMVMAGFTAAPEEDPLLYEAALHVRYLCRV